MRDKNQHEFRSSWVGRLPCVVASLAAPLLLLLLSVSLPAEQATAASYAILFECDFGCTVGVDEPTGTLSIDDSILLDAANADSFVPIQSIQVTGFGFTWSSPGSPAFAGASPEAYLDSNGKPIALAWTASAAGIGTNFKLFDFDSAPRVWSCEGDCPVLGGAFGSYSVVPVPEPSAALLFGAGILIVSAIRGRTISDTPDTPDTPDA